MPVIRSWKTIALVLVGAAIAVGAIVQGLYPSADNAMFEYGGRAISRGEVPYRDFFDNKLPSIYYVNALWQVLFGEHYQLHAGAEVIIALASGFLLFILLRKFELHGSIFAAAIFTAMLVLFFPLNTTEIYALPLLLAAAWSAEDRSALLAGLFVGIAATFWLPSILMLFVILYRVHNVQQRIASAACALAVPAFVIAALFSVLGSDTVSILTRSWLSYTTAPIAGSVHRHFPILNHFDTPLRIGVAFWTGIDTSGAAALLVLLVAVVRKPQTEAQRFGLRWTLVALLGSATGTRFFSHYFIPSLPALVFTACSYLQFVNAWTVARRVLISLAALLIMKALYDAGASWADAAQRAATIERIGAALRPIARHDLTLMVDSYEPGLYLAIDPKLRNPYDLISVPLARFVRSAGGRMTSADIIVSTRGSDPPGVAVCARTAWPWRVSVSQHVRNKFTACE